LIGNLFLPQGGGRGFADIGIGALQGFDEGWHCGLSGGADLPQCGGGRGANTGIGVLQAFDEGWHRGLSGGADLPQGEGGEDELARLLTVQETLTGLTDEDATPELPEKPVTQPGDLWLLSGLGGHRVLCGDDPRHDS